MSSRSASAAENIFNNLLKAKGVAKTVRSDVRSAQGDVTRLMSLTSQLSRGDVTGLVTYLAGTGQVGLAAALIVAGAAVTYGIYQKLTTPKPTEVYMWRYPT